MRTGRDIIQFGFPTCAELLHREIGQLRDKKLSLPASRLVMRKESSLLDPREDQT